MSIDTILLNPNILPEQKKRIRKLYTEKYYLLGYRKEDNEILISGSTNNTYKIKIRTNNNLLCSCMDCSINYYKKIYCKHICFIFLKIIQSTDENFFTKFILSEDDILTLKNILEKMFEKDKNLFQLNNNERNLGDECPICYEKLLDDCVLSKCPECNNAIHTECVQKWLKYNSKTCVFCRSESWKLFI
jgi:hypothetical protein